MISRALMGSALAAMFFASGCAYVNPMVGVVKHPGATADDKNTMPHLGAAVDELNARISELESKRDETLHTGRVLDIVTFGFGAGAAGAALRPGHSHAVTNLTFGAGASYAGSTLFGPRDVAMVYNAGAAAIACVSDKGAGLRGTAISSAKRLSVDANGNYPDAFINGCTPSTSQQTQLDAAKTLQAKVRLTLAYALASDADEAKRAREAANNVIKAVNTQILARANSPDAIFAAAKGLAPHATGTTIQPASVTGQASRMGQPPAALQSPCGPEVSDRLTEFANNYAALDKAITGAVNAMGALDTACTVDAPTVEPLTLSQEEVTVSKDITINVVISGGRLPYRLIPPATASNDILVQLVPPRTITITGKSTITANTGAIEYQIGDNSVLSTPKKLKISAR